MKYKNIVFDFGNVIGKLTDVIYHRLQLRTLSIDRCTATYV